MITLTNPDLLELHAACLQHVPEYYDYANGPFAATLTLHRYAFCSCHENGVFTVEIKCKGNGCKSREIIGRGEAETLEKAGMIALLEANGVKVRYT